MSEPRPDDAEARRVSEEAVLRDARREDDPRLCELFASVTMESDLSLAVEAGTPDGQQSEWTNIEFVQTTIVIIVGITNITDRV